ncbi:hypothetical protein Xszus_00475 [Xenorhabdus szentirmaii]|uniref:Uncharacterized protein n=1 Tax=Xenorhabdus szentirmaii DSM 16338 TaxID=1427518 RepID=W1IW17_9GAMM|nr:hypothetical protein Xsze_03631 [Xenorhabdus szentirmaii DSM 16338]PHM40800.1 hypothetical protein Xszus_00475 [Xenorhabdus szentirmaii]CDL81821.1 exported hypothetical protein [Xenorhabdus szentirmaii DSM 16338]
MIFEKLLLALLFSSSILPLKSDQDDCEFSSLTEQTLSIRNILGLIEID